MANILYLNSFTDFNMAQEENNKKKSTSIASDVWNSYKKAVRNYYNQLKPDPDDNFLVKGFKYLGMGIVILISILMSPIVFVVLIIALIGAL